MKKKNSWFRMYSEVLDDPKVQRLPGDLFKSWVNILCMACKNDGTVNVSDLAFGLRISDKKGEEVLKALLATGLVEIAENKIIPHNWEGRQFLSDTSTDRVKRFRNRHANDHLKRFGNVSCNVSVTPDVTQEDDQIKRYSNGSETLHVTPPDTDTDTEKRSPLPPISKSTDIESKKRKAPGQRYAPEFERFWSGYPRKVNKGAAYKAWRKENPPLDACLETLEWQTKTLDWTKDGGQYIPHPATWINARGWENQPFQAAPTPRRITRLAY